MSVECRRKKSVEGRCKMSLLTCNRASFRADHHERSEVRGAEAEGLANDTGTDPARGLRQGRGSRVGSSPADQAFVGVFGVLAGHRHEMKAARVAQRVDREMHFLRAAR